MNITKRNGALIMGKMAVYRVTFSAIDTVKVGSFLVDEDHGERRDWHLYDSTSGDFVNGFAGERTHRLCKACWDLPQRRVVAKGHEGTHGSLPNLVPSGAAA